LSPYAKQPSPSYQPSPRIIENSSNQSSSDDKPRQPSKEIEIIHEERATDDAYPGVTKAIMEYVRTNGQSPGMLQTKFQLRYQFEQHLRRLFPNCDLFIFGSSASGFGSMTSDMDMCLVTNNNVHLKDVKLLYRVKSVLCSAYPLIDVQVIAAKVPILKFVHRPTNIQCDLNINNSDGVRNTHLLKFFTNCDPRFVPLVLALKRWARHHKINDASQGTLSSYALTLMALHYLQVGVKPPVLPNLIADNPDVFHPRRALITLSFNDEIRGNFVSTNKSTVGELFIGFLTYYSKEFRYDYLGISVREARAVAKRTAKEFSKYIFVEEPYNLDNVARAVRKQYEPYIKKVIDESYSVIMEAKDLDSVLTFNVDIFDKAPVTNPAPPKPGNNADTAKSSAGESSSSTKTSPEETQAESARSEVAELNEMASKRRFTVTYDVVNETGPPHAKVFHTRCSVILKKDGAETLLAAMGNSNNKRLSKMEAAKQMLRLLEERKMDVAAKESFP